MLFKEYDSKSIEPHINRNDMTTFEHLSMSELEAMYLTIDILKIINNIKETLLANSANMCNNAKRLNRYYKLYNVKDDRLKLDPTYLSKLLELQSKVLELSEIENLKLDKVDTRELDDDIETAKYYKYYVPLNEIYKHLEEEEFNYYKEAFGIDSNSYEFIDEVA